MALAPDIAEALTALERSPGPVTAWCRGQLAAWRQTGDPSSVEADRIESLLGRAAKPEQPRKRTGGTTARSGPDPRCVHCGKRASDPQPGSVLP